MGEKPKMTPEQTETIQKIANRLNKKDINGHPLRSKAAPSKIKGMVVMFGCTPEATVINPDIVIVLPHTSEPSSDELQYLYGEDGAEDSDRTFIDDYMRMHPEITSYLGSISSTRFHTGFHDALSDPDRYLSK
jgi:hypothetical protein